MSCINCNQGSVMGPSRFIAVKSKRIRRRYNEDGPKNPVNHHLKQNDRNYDHGLDEKPLKSSHRKANSPNLSYSANKNSIRRLTDKMPQNYMGRSKLAIWCLGLLVTFVALASGWHSVHTLDLSRGDFQRNSSSSVPPTDQNPSDSEPLIATTISPPATFLTTTRAPHVETKNETMLVVTDIQQVASTNRVVVDKADAVVSVKPDSALEAVQGSQTLDPMLTAASKKKKKSMKKSKKMEKKHKEWKKGKKHKKKKYESKKKKGGSSKKKKGKKEKKKWGMEKKGHKKKGNFKKKKWGSKKKMKKGHKKGKKGHKMLKDKGHKKKGFKKIYHKEEWGKKKKWHDIKREKKWNTKQKKWKKKWHQEKGKKYKGKHMKKYHKKNKHGKKYKKEKKSKWKKHKGEKFKKGHKKKKEEYSKKKEGGKKKKMKKSKKEMKKKKKG